MSELNSVCGRCGWDVPVNWKGRFCGNCGRSLIGSSGGIGGPFAKTLLIVVLLWLVTPIVVAIPVWVTTDPRAELNVAYGVIAGTGLIYALYAFAGVISGLIAFFTNRPVGAGILAGTGLGLLLGFVTCYTVAGALATATR